MSYAFDVGRCDGGDTCVQSEAEGFGVRRAERLDCEGAGVDPATIWGSKRRMHRADDERMRARHKGESAEAPGVACDKGRVAESGSEAWRRHHVVDICSSASESRSRQLHILH